MSNQSRICPPPGAAVSSPDGGAADPVGRSCAFAILTATPDLLEQNLIGPLLDRLSRLGALPVAAVPTLFSEADFFEIYSGRVSHVSAESRIHSSWLSPRLFTRGTSLVLVLRSQSLAGSLQQTIREHKGRARLGDYRRDDLRGLSRQVDRSFSLIHCPDDEDSFHHELRLLFDADSLGLVLNAGRPSLSAEDVAGVVSRPRLEDEPHLFSVLSRLVEQGLCLLLCDPRTAAAPDDVRAVLTAVREAHGRIARLPVDAALPASVWQKLEPLADRIRALGHRERGTQSGARSLAALRSVHTRVELLTVLADLCTRTDVEPRLSRMIAEIFHRCAVPLAEWDCHRLDVIAAYHGGDSL